MVVVRNSTTGGSIPPTKLKKQIMKLHIDIETYSSVDIKSSGAYKYCESIDFEILLIAYAFNDDPVKIIDVTESGIPDFLKDALLSVEIEKHAYNANFERIAFKAVGIDSPISQWHCTMVKAAYCGLPLGLGIVSNVLKLNGKGKLSSGSNLIKYFCCPVAATKTNGGRVRNFKEHDLFKWEEFKMYCMNDVVAEREIDRLLSKYQLPFQEQVYYCLDQMINDTGIMIDIPMATNICSIDQENFNNLESELKEITGLDNPCSVSQLKGWISDKAQKEIKSLNKSELPDLLQNVSDDTITRVILLRQKIAKTSIKKYTAMLNCVGEDGRIRGLFQFYGANRTGRWAGRLVQVQNLPQNHLDNLTDVRNTIANESYSELKNKFEDISDTLSQLIRTTFIASDNNILAIIDFSSIEARVIAWLANEQWRLDVFNSHGKIYEASASMMFGVPIEQIDKGSELRQKGKVAELALGYQGSIGALKAMGGERMGLTDTEMKDIVSRWRLKSSKIVKLWADIEKASIYALKTGKKVVLSDNKGVNVSFDGLFLIIELPSGRGLYYYKPKIEYNDYGKELIVYQGLNQVTKKWESVDIYGGKFVENIVQAIARDILANAIMNVDSQGYKIVMHVHDELVVDIPEFDSKKSLEKINNIMCNPPHWALDLPLKADGYLTKFYKKD